ncbi:MAG: hypothetical protein QOC92_1920 [Acidimicrobiaceae bacterium]|jgi:uncharacterized membrane protein
METESAPHLECPACRVIDRADGVEDGRLYRIEALKIGNERRMVGAIKRTQDRVADRITAFAGSLNFVYIHGVWFAIWIAVNAGLFSAGLIFDEFPYGLLTMIVSLEAIFLSTFVMVSQNRQAARSDIRADLDFENNLRGEIWSVHIGEQLGLDAGHVERVVLEAIEGYRRETLRTPR